jgi:hypothetical protein
MRDRTLLAHLSVTEGALQNERDQIAHQLEFVRQLRAEGHSTHAARELLQSMKDELYLLERHRELLMEQLGLFTMAAPPAHLDRRPR